MHNNKIVLGFPYSGALLWLLNAERQYNQSIKERYAGSHPYYATLYGDEHHKIVDETVSLTLMFDEIYLAPADVYLPDYEKFRDGQKYFNKDLGIVSSWDWSFHFGSSEDSVAGILSDPLIESCLINIPVALRGQLVRDAINQLYICQKYNLPIFAKPIYLQMCSRINELFIGIENLQTKSPLPYQDAIKIAFQTSSLHFSISSLDEYYVLRQEKSVKRYGEAFRSHITELSNGNLDKISLYKAMVEAMNREAISNKISGSIDITSSLTSIASIIPIVGTATGIAGIGLDAASALSKKYSDHNRWWQFAAKISETLTRDRIEKDYLKLINGTE
ncbi:hypothetical protein LZD49_15720 [Dyadobacter sp. CY261]|uniref:hypothetical protein n=1 Tax=Dyadobacter sp. CY261 TaxID=2907203 RepID=UPI001F1CD1B4|nr:hypothetical protein [Dyadobacter sp. CY261]MCF0071926.1 hypothetical protein [Dyadobacter sp. CY261]